MPAAAKLQAAALRRSRPDGMCPRCRDAPSRPAVTGRQPTGREAWRLCEGCHDAADQLRAAGQRNAYRIKHGVPLDAPVRMGRWNGKPGECDRCTSPAVTTTDRGEKACERHVAIFAELAADRSRGMVIDIEEEGDE